MFIWISFSNVYLTFLPGSLKFAKWMLSWLLKCWAENNCVIIHWLWSKWLTHHVILQKDKYYSWPFHTTLWCSLGLAWQNRSWQRRNWPQEKNLMTKSHWKISWKNKYHFQKLSLSSCQFKRLLSFQVGLPEPILRVCLYCLSFVIASHHLIYFSLSHFF